MLITPLLLQATAQGHGACLLDGKLIEQLHAENAQRIIQLHENIQAFEEAAGIALGEINNTLLHTTAYYCILPMHTTSSILPLAILPLLALLYCCYYCWQYYSATSSTALLLLVVVLTPVQL
jgi:hypothetical protein